MAPNDKQITARLYDDTNLEPMDPFDVFEAWFAAAAETEPNDPNAVSLATVDATGMPDVRAMLLNGRDARGFVFYTNLESQKGRELAANPQAALNFHWKILRRQVRIRGHAELVPPEEADAYFATRPRGSQLGAHASYQSQPLENRGELVGRVAALTVKYGVTGPVPRPDHWSGYRVVPQTIEFWKDGKFRLHDRMLFSRTDGGWTRQRLSP